MNVTTPETRANDAAWAFCSKWYGDDWESWDEHVWLLYSVRYRVIMNDHNRAMQEQIRDKAKQGSYS